MATVTAAITLSSAAGDLLTDALSLSDSVSITASETTGLARAKLTSTAKGTASGSPVTASSYT